MPKSNLRFAFFQTIPVLLGYLFLGVAFGLLVQRAGYPFWWAFLASLLIYAGSMQFVMIGFLTGGVSLLSAALTTLSVNSRHVFYGLSFLDTFRGMGKAYPYMIFSLTDETYSLLCSVKIPSQLAGNKVRLYIALLDQGYWLFGSLVGVLLGEVIAFNSTGVEFAMTALFVVIFLEQWRSAESHSPAVIGFGCGMICLVVLGPQRFLLPALLLTVALLLLFRQKPPVRHQAEDRQVTEHV